MLTPSQSREYSSFRLFRLMILRIYANNPRLKRMAIICMRAIRCCFFG